MSLLPRIRHSTDPCFFDIVAKKVCIWVDLTFERPSTSGSCFCTIHSGLVITFGADAVPHRTIGRAVQIVSNCLTIEPNAPARGWTRRGLESAQPSPRALTSH